jgi:LPS-assembly lipoprotein
MPLKKLLFSFIFTVSLAGCGFQPMMTGENENPQKFTLKITGTGYSTYKFRRELEKQLALTPKINDKVYVLSVALSEGYVPIAYGTDATISRSQVQATATYDIKETDRPIANGAVTSYSSYILNYTEEFSTRSAQAAASERTLVNLAEEVSREVMLKIRSAPEKEEKRPKRVKLESDW